MDADDVALPARLEEQARLLDSDRSVVGVACRVEGFPLAATGEGMQRYLAWQNDLIAPEQLARERFVEARWLRRP
jgi:hypothetical protein